MFQYPLIDENVAVSSARKLQSRRQGNCSLVDDDIHLFIDDDNIDDFRNFAVGGNSPLTKTPSVEINLFLKLEVSPNLRYF